jgi:hypothetical protein
MVSLGEKPSRKKCSAGIIQEGNELMDEEVEGTVMDGALLAAAQRAEHYEIATYGCVRNWAKELREDDDAELLAKALKEEKETDAKLTEIARRVNPSAMSEGQTEEEISLREKVGPASAQSARSIPAAGDISCERQRLAEKGKFCNSWPALESFSFFGRAYASQFLYRMKDHGQDCQ